MSVLPLISFLSWAYWMLCDMYMRWYPPVEDYEIIQEVIVRVC